MFYNYAKSAVEKKMFIQYCRNRCTLSRDPISTGMIFDLLFLPLSGTGRLSQVHKPTVGNYYTYFFFIIVLTKSGEILYDGFWHSIIL